MARKVEPRAVPTLLNQAYTQILERGVLNPDNSIADAPALFFYGCKLVSGDISVKTLVKSIGTSDEYLQRFYDSLSPSDAIEKVYQHFLARPSHEEGKKYYVDQLHNGRKIRDIIDEVIDSNEYIQKFGDDKVPS